MSQFGYDEQDDKLNNKNNQRDDEEDDDDEESDLVEPEAVEMMDDEDETSSSSLSSLTNSINKNVKSLTNATNNNDTRFFISMGANNDEKTKTESVNNDHILNNSITIDDEGDDRKRFQIELEFVQSLANPYYLNFLAQRGYFTNQKFLNYLKYLMYWKEPEYCKYIVYPQCLALLDLLQQEYFIKEIVNSSFSKFIDEQLLLIWLNYKKRRDWKRFDPTKLPKNVEKILKNKESTNDNSDSIDVNETGDYFSANKFIENEKY
jgi:mediator of RNA polymerase II transcription subunit 31